MTRMSFEDQFSSLDHPVGPVAARVAHDAPHRQAGGLAYASLMVAPFWLAILAAVEILLLR